MAIFLILWGSLMGALNNLCLRRSIDVGVQTKSYLVFQFGSSAGLAFLFFYLRGGGEVETFSWVFSTLSLIGGLCLALMMWGIGGALALGPPGLSLSAFNGVSLLPPLVMSLLVGEEGGYVLQVSHLLGLLFVALGLGWSAKTSPPSSRKQGWGKRLALALVAHLALLLVVEWRAYLMRGPLGTNAGGYWFTPLLFFSATLLQIILFWKQERRLPQFKEAAFGFLGGILAGSSVTLLIAAPEIATPKESIMLFPLFAILLIFLCNLWGRWLYKEAVHWGGVTLSLLGVCVGSIDWRALLQLLNQ